MTNVPVTAQVSVVDRATAPIRRINTAINRMTGPARRIGQAMRRIGVESGFPVVARQVGGLTRSVGALGTRLRGLLGPLTAIGGVLSIAGIQRMISGFANSADELAKMTDRTGESVEALQQFRFAAELGGVSSNELNDAMRRLNRGIAEVGSGRNQELTELFESLGIEIRGANGELRTATEIMPELAEGFRVNTNAALRNRMAQTLMGRSSEAMISFLAQGEESMARYLDEALRYNLITEEQARQAEDYNDSITRMRWGLSGLTNTIAASLIPVIQPMIESFTEWVMVNREIIAQRVDEVVRSLVEWLQAIEWGDVAERFSVWGDRIAWVVDNVGGLENALVGLVAFLNLHLIVALGQVAWAILGVGAAILATPIGWFFAILGVIAGGAWLIRQNWEGMPDWFHSMWDGVKDAFEGHRRFLGGAFSLDVEEAIEGLKQLWRGYRDFFGPLFEGIKGYFRSFLEWIDSVFNTSLSESLDRLQEWQGSVENPELGVETPHGVTPFGGEPFDVPDNDNGNGGNSLGDRSSLIGPMIDREQRQLAARNHVVVSFENTPRGTRVNTRDADDVDVDVGYSMRDFG